MDRTQQLIVDLSKEDVTINIASVYARYSNLERLELWDELEYIGEDNVNP